MINETKTEEFKIVKLKRLAVTDLSIRYAEKVSEGKVRHYPVYFSTRPEDVQALMEEAVGGRYEIEPEEEVKKLEIVDLSDKVSNWTKKIFNKKLKTDEPYYQYSSRKKGVLNFILHYTGKILSKLTQNYLRYLPNKLALAISEASVRNALFLTIFGMKTTEKNLKEAILELETIAVLNNFKGFLNNISSMETSDIVGDGKKRFIVFFSGFVDGEVEFGKEYLYSDNISETLSELPEIEVIKLKNLDLGVEFDYDIKNRNELQTGEYLND
jgi:hypothetical protein